MSGAARDAFGRETLDEREHLAEHEKVAERDTDEKQDRAGEDERQHQLLLVRVKARRDEGPGLVQHHRQRDQEDAISVIFSGTTKGEITEVAIRSPLGQVGHQRRGQQS
jgi:hypothetical protein